MQGYKFLVHRIFQNQMDHFLEVNPGHWGSFIDQCRKACADPHRVGRPLAGVARKKLQGNIRRLWVGGGEKFRFIYIVHNKVEVILPVYLSSQRRKDFDYDRIPWEDYASEVYNDFVSGNTEAFHFMRLPK